MRPITFHLPISLPQFHYTMTYGKDVDDMVINAYLTLIQSRAATNPAFPTVTLLSTYFYKFLKSPGERLVAMSEFKTNLFDNELLICPIHSVNHWSLVVVLVKYKLILYADSMGVLEEQHEKWLNGPLPTGWDIGLFPIALPRQPPASRECGPFVLEFADYVSRRIINVSFPSNSGPLIRERIVYELVNKKLLSRHCNPSFF